MQRGSSNWVLNDLGEGNPINPDSNPLTLSSLTLF